MNYISFSHCFVSRGVVTMSSFGKQTNPWAIKVNQSESKEKSKISKFNVFEYNQKFMAWLGIHSYRLEEPTNEFFSSLGAYYIALTIGFVSIVCACTTLFASDFKMVIQAAFALVAAIQSGGMFISVGLNMKKIKTFHLSVQDIVDAGMLK